MELGSNSAVEDGSRKASTASRFKVDPVQAKIANDQTLIENSGLEALEELSNGGQQIVETAQSPMAEPVPPIVNGSISVMSQEPPKEPPVTASPINLEAGTGPLKAAVVEVPPIAVNEVDDSLEPSLSGVNTPSTGSGGLREGSVEAPAPPLTLEDLHTMADEILKKEQLQQEASESTKLLSAEEPTAPVPERRGKFVSFLVGSPAGGPSERGDGEDPTDSMSLNRDTAHSEMSGEGTHGSNTQTGTMNVKSFRNVETIDKLPNIDHYRNVMSMAGAMATRPTLADLQDGGVGEKTGNDMEMGPMDTEEKSPEETLETMPVIPDKTGPKFGWLKGVLVRCILNILGVMLYLRLTWVTAQAGILYAVVVVLLSCLVTVLTTLSMCAICTNGEIRGGGAYFMLSRSLGPEFGGSIGLIFAFANAVGVAMYIVGFAETVVDLMNSHGLQIVDGGINDIRIIGFITAIFVLSVVMIGMEWEANAQIVLLFILGVSIIDYYIGVLIPPTESQKAKGVTGLSANTFAENFMPDYVGEQGSFFQVFSVFFPAATGILAGANISGDLLDPKTAIPKGTILAIIITTFIYLSFVFLAGASNVRYAAGPDAANVTTCILNATELLLMGGAQQPVMDDESCEFGLFSPKTIQVQSGWAPLIFAGIFAATLSSALASMVSAPKVLEAVCKDRLFPYIHVLSKGFGKSNEPYLAYILAFVIAMAMIAIGELNSVAPIISNFFLASYALINYACFDASFADSPGFRPGFRYYNMWLSLAGALLCVAVMFVISWVMALVTFFIIIFLYGYIHHRKPEVNWGSSTQAHSYKSALSAMLKLNNTEDHVKNFRPQILALTGHPVSRPSLVDFATNITKDNSMLICGHVIVKEPNERLKFSLKKMNQTTQEWLKKRKVKSFYCPVVASSFKSGVASLNQLAGLGKLRPNIVLIGYKNNWKQCSTDQINEYFNIIHDTFDLNLGLCILRLPRGLDFSDLYREFNMEDYNHLRLVPETFPREASSGDLYGEYGASTDQDSASRKTSSNESNATNSRSTTPNPLFPNRSSYSRLATAATKPSATTNGNPPLPSVHPGNKSNVSNSTVDTEIHQSEQRSADRANKPWVKVVPPLEESSESARHLLGYADDDGCDESGDNAERPPSPEEPYITPRGSPSIAAHLRRMSRQQKQLVASISEFQRRIKKGIIDVYWLFDDGGLTLLIPYLLTLPHSYLEGARLRVFTIASSKSHLEQEQRSIATLLSKFRINFSDVFVIPDITKKPSKSSLLEFEELIKDFRVPDDASEAEFPNSVYISDAEMLGQKDKINRQIRVRELLLQNSKDSSLVVLTLPVPRRGACSSALYMAWLETLSRDLPPVILVRGNQQSVLTFYS